MRSKYYRTMIIAFSGGVLPKLTLKEGSTCDPTYTSEYKESQNNSVTDGRLKSFILESYDKRGQPSRQFCDYREGLVCNQQTSKCECPPGTEMGPISQGSTVKRCLVKENEVCSLIDLDHDPSSNYGALKMHLPEMVFNLEKPLSCKMGTQCRFKSSTSPTTPLCYDVNSGPWDKGRWDMDYGDECTLGLYADTGPCLTKEYVKPLPGYLYIGGFGGYTCFNFGPRSRPKSPQVGFCAHEMGNYALSGVFTGNEGIWQWNIDMIYFVSPATTSLRGQDLLLYVRKYVQEVGGYFLFSATYGTMTPSAGDPCNVAKSEKMSELWNFYQGLENAAAPATITELQPKLDEAEALALIVDRDKKICRIYSEVSDSSKITHALRCEQYWAPGSSVENDGEYKLVPENEDVTLEWAKGFSQYKIHVWETVRAQKSEEKNYRKDIFEPDLECDPNLGPHPNSQGASPSIDNGVLEGGYCSPGRICHEDYGISEYYDKNCQLKNANTKLWRNCPDEDDNRSYEKCEKQFIDKLIKEELKTMSSYGGLGRGDACRSNTEYNLRLWIEKGDRVGGNRYSRLVKIKKNKSDIGQNKFKLCDRTRLLECTQDRTCECLPGTQPREVISAGMTVYSDYCYVASGNCNRERSLTFITDKSTQLEITEIKRHYEAREGEGGSESSCQGSNWCVFTKKDPWFKDMVCTTEDTGNTGHNGSEPVTTTTVKTTTVKTRTTTNREGKLTCQGPKCGWQDAGEARKEIHAVLKMVLLIKILTIIV